MDDETLDTIDRFWARSLGCDRGKLEGAESGIFVRKRRTSYTENHSQTDVDILLKKEQKLVSSSEEARARLENLGDLRDIDISYTSLQEAGLELEELLGPAFLAYADESSFESVPDQEVYRLTSEDKSELEGLVEESDAEEIDNSIGDKDPETDIMFGRFVDEELVAVSDYKFWDEEIAFISVFVSKDYRGRGFGKEAVSRAAEHSLENGLIPSYRTLEKWSASVNLAKSLGFEKYATTYLLKLKEK